MHAADPNIRPWFAADADRYCVYCRWVDVCATTRSDNGRGLGCTNPKCLHGQAGERKSCCSFEREPGSDDDLEPPL